MKKAQRLTGLRLKFLSIVDNPANQGAQVVLAKRASADVPMTRMAFMTQQLKAGLSMSAAAAAWRKRPSNLKKSNPTATDVLVPQIVGVIMKAARVGTIARALAKLAGDAVPLVFRATVAEAVLGPLAKDAPAFDDVIESQEMQDMLNALSQTLWGICQDPDSDAEAKQTAIGESLTQFYAALTADDDADDTTLATDPAAPGVTKTENDDMTPEDLTKAIEKAVTTAVDPLRTQLEKATTDNAVLVSKLAEAETAVAKLAAQDAQRALIAKAQAVITASGSPAKAEDIATTLAKLDDDGQAAVLELVKQNGALAAEAGLFKAWGASADVADGSPEAKVTALATAKMQSDPKLTREAATAAVWVENPDLYEDTLTGEG